MSDIYAKAREFSRFLSPGSGAPVTLRQGVIAGIEMGSVSILLSDNTFPVGGINFLESYKPKIGETVWMLKSGADTLVLGDIVIPGGVEQDPLHYVGQTDYGEPAFQNNWQNIGFDGTYTYESVNFYKDPDGFVHLAGAIKNTSGSAYNTVIFTLPAGYRPDYTHRTPIVAASGALTTKLWAVEVQEDGDVIVCTANNPGSGSTSVKNLISLEGIRFMAAEDTEYERIHEWVPLARAGNWTWDTSAQSKIPPSQWHRWDGLVRCRGRLKTTVAAEDRVAGISERSARQRWNKLFPTLMVESATSDFEPVRIDVQPSGRELARITSAFDNELLLDGLQWFADIPESYWTPLELANSWVNYSPSAHWGPASYFKDGYGVVHIRGLISSGTTTLDTTLTTLPVHCRPLNRKIFPGWMGTPGPTSIGVNSTGDIKIASGGVNSSHFTLDTIAFRANPDYTF